MRVKRNTWWAFFSTMPLLLASLLLVFGSAPDAMAAPDVKAKKTAEQKTADQGILKSWWIVNSESKDPHVVVPTLADQDTLYIYFSPNEKMCQKAYGDNWFAMCTRRTGMAGRRLEGRNGEIPVITPPVAGEWRWQSDNSFAFTPNKPWPADTTYSVDIPPEVLPEGITVTDSERVKTSDVQARMDGDFKFDPQNPSKSGAGMALSGTIAFNYPMDKAGVLSRLSLVAESQENAGKKALLGKPEWQWGPVGSNVLFYSVPVLELPEESSKVNMALAAGSMAISGGIGGMASEFSIALPGKKELFRLTGADALMMDSPDLGAKQTLALQFSMPVAPSLAVKGLEVLLLPRQRVDNGDKTRSPYSWWSKAELSPEVLKRTEAVTCTAYGGSADSPSMLVSLSFDRELEAGRSLLVKLPGGLKSASGYTMSAESVFLVQIPAPSQDLRIMQNGAILALPGEKTLSLYSRNLSHINYEIMQVRPEYVSQLVASRPDFVAPYMYSMSLYDVGEVTRGEIPLALRNAESPQFSALDLAPMLKNGQKGFFIVSLDGLREGAVVSSDRRFVLVTDIGLIRKQANDGASQVFTVSLSTGKPLKGVDVRVLGANGLPVFQAQSDGQGLVKVPDLDGLKLEKKPSVLLASVGDDLSFLPLNDSMRQVNYDSHDTGMGALVRAYDGLVGWMFGQRGVYRPGETVHFGYAVKHGDWTDEKSLKGLPLRVNVYDPRGNIFSRDDVTLSADGFGELVDVLPETAITGKYTVDMMLMVESNQGDSPVLASSSFRVEEFQPDTMKLTVRLEPSVSKGWLYIDAGADEGVAKKTPIKAEIALNNLFGTPAAERRVTARMESSMAEFAFREYPGWRFYNAAPLERIFTENLPESATDPEGKASFVLPDSFYSKSSMGLTVQAEGFDAAGGRSVRASASLLVSPLPWVLGWKTGSNLDYLRQNSEATLDLMAISPDLTLLDPGTLTLETVSVTYHKSLMRDEQGQYSYDMVRQEKVESMRPLSLPATGTTLKLDLSQPGEWQLVIRNAKGDVAASIPYVVAGQSPAAFGEDRSPVLTARLDKSDYAPGADMEVSLSTPYKGSGLITVERDKVESFVWFHAEAGNTVQRLRLPKNFEGKAYINVMYFRALDDKDIFTKPLAVAVLPFTVNMESRDAKLSLRPLPQEGTPQAGGEFVARPGTLKVEVKADKPCRVVVFAVDEGILQLASYATPNPLQALLGNRALAVTTTQYFDLLMPEYSLMKRALSAFGGGEGLNFAALGQNAFRRPGEKSAVFWSGIMELSGSTVVDIPTPPSFSGRLRIMAVGVNESQVGAARTDVLVRPDVVIQPSLPLFAAPGDEFEAVVAVTDMSDLPPTPGKDGREVVVSATTEGGLEVLDAAPLGLVLQPEREQHVVLRLRALDNPGGATLTIRVAPSPSDATGGQALGQTVSRPVGMSIRPASPRTSQAILGRAQENKGLFQADIPFTRKLYPQHAALSASMSAVPLPVAHGLFRYVANYPFACTEQIISGAFPALFMLRYPPFAPQGEEFTPDILRQRVLNALAVIQSRALDSGELCSWPGGYAGDFFLAVYAADFMTTAEEMGVSVDVQTKVKLINYLTQFASSTPGSMHEARVNAYAAWVLTRNGVLTSNIMATLTAWMENYQPSWRSDITSVFMAGCWRMMMENTEARTLLDGYRPQAPTKVAEQQYWMNDLTTRSLYLSVVAGQFSEMLTSDGSQSVVAQVLDLAATGYYDTQSAAQASRALLAYSAAQQKGQQSNGLTLQALDAAGKELALAPVQSGSVQNGPVLQASLQSGSDNAADILPNLASLRFSSSSPFYWQVESTGYDSVLPTKPVSEGMEVRREFVDVNGQPVTSFRQGDEVLVRIHARAYGKSVDNIAIVDMLPGCFEMVMSQGGNVVSTDSAVSALPRMNVEYVERREDRLLLFPSLGTKETTYSYRVRVTSRGTFTLPPLTASAMYDPRVMASTAAEKIRVE